MAGSVLSGGTPPTSSAVAPMAAGSAASAGIGLRNAPMMQPNAVLSAQAARPPMSGAPGAQPNPGAAIGGVPHPATTPATPAQMRPRPLMARGQGYQ
jgi:hypothetical protein